MIPATKNTKDTKRGGLALCPFVSSVVAKRNYRMIPATKNTKDTKKMDATADNVPSLCDAIRQTAYDLHVYLGVGYLEKVYENALCHRLEKRGMSVRRQVPIRVSDMDGYPIGEYIADVIVENMILELKATSTLTDAHVAQTLNYLKATGLKHAMLINFGSETFQCRKLAL